MAESVTNSYAVENSTNMINNTSNVTVYAIYTKTSGEYASDNPIWRIYVNGTLVNSGTQNFNAGTTGDIPLGSWTGDVSHNADGTGSMTWSVLFEGKDHPAGDESSSKWKKTGTITKTLTTLNRGLMRIKVNGTWRVGIPYIKVGGVWRQGAAFIKTGGSWRRGS